jgi:hypothetical protein
MLTNNDKLSEAFQMSPDQVNEWFAQNQIDQLIVSYLNVCDGAVMKQLFDMKHTSPQFYDQSLTKIEGINMVAILKFNAALDKLFI